MRWLAALALCGGCDKLFGVDEVKPVDAGATSDAIDSANNAVCIGSPTGLVRYCPPAALAPVLLSGSIDTDTYACAVPEGGGPICVVAGSSITMSGTVVATGSRALALMATGNITLSGTLDVSSHDLQVGAGADPGTCVQPMPFDAAMSSEASSGGPGGSLGDVGGNAGQGTSSGAILAAPAVTLMTLTSLRGGCPGSYGGTDGILTARALGGSGGGAVALVANGTVEIGSTGVVLAFGAGGAGALKDSSGFLCFGGGGGGSGGLVYLEGSSIVVAGLVHTGGGGGGSGSTSTQAGNAGSSPNTVTPTNPAPGGASAGSSSNAGGTCGAYMASRGNNGGSGAACFDADGGGGGGGGGAAGIVRLAGPADTTGGTIVGVSF